MILSNEVRATLRSLGVEDSGIELLETVVEKVVRELVILKRGGNSLGRREVVCALEATVLDDFDATLEGGGDSCC